MNNRSSRLSDETAISATIEKLSHDGRGIARIDGKTTFIQGALPDEEVTFQYTRKKKDYDEGRLVSVVQPSSKRVDPLCQHYHICGGCSLQHLEATAQLAEKEQLLLDLLKRVGHVHPEHVFEPLKGASKQYRHKARLSVRFVEKKQKTLVGFREQLNPRYVADIEQCPILHSSVDTAIPDFRRLIDGLENPKSIAQIEVAAGDEQVALILRNLSTLSLADEEHLCHYGEQTGFRLFLQPSGPDSVYLLYPKDGCELLDYALPEEGVRFQFHPTDFTQVNADLNRKMVRKAMTLLALSKEDNVLDLFCGLGNFSLPAAQQARLVVGVEGSERMVERAQMNAQLNGLTNTAFYCANLEDEIALQHINESFTKVLLDPPRAGAQMIVKNIHQLNPGRIVYVSCNPATLARDAGILVHQQGYRLVDVGVMDMFPHTAHVEAMALFVKGNQDG